VTCIHSNEHFILVGSLKGKVIVYNSELKKIDEVSLASFKISALAFFPAPGPTSYHCLLGDACGKMTMILVSPEGTMPVK
jgi:hypothetical protein